MLNLPGSNTELKPSADLRKGAIHAGLRVHGPCCGRCLLQGLHGCRNKRARQEEVQVQSIGQLVPGEQGVGCASAACSPSTVAAEKNKKGGAKSSRSKALGAPSQVDKKQSMPLKAVRQQRESGSASGSLMVIGTEQLVPVG